MVAGTGSLDCENGMGSISDRGRGRAGGECRWEGTWQLAGLLAFMLAKLIS